jgi:sec-independent protein translocase protein TatA
MLPLAFFPSLHGPELLIIGFVALMIFGNRLPNVMRSLGRSVTEFKKGVSGIEEEIDQAGKVPAEKSSNPSTPS